jgi:4Fe-4S ferredoxin
MKEVIFQTKEDKTLVYLPEKCIGCSTCTMICPKDDLVIGSVGAVARGLINKDFLQKGGGGCILCGMCSKVCPVGALEVRKAGKSEIDDSYLYGSLKPTFVKENCIHCGMCKEVCPQDCIEVQKRKLSQDGSLAMDGKTIIDQKCCVHCGWCASICPVNAITMEKPFSGEFSRDEKVCQACRTCVDTCPCDALFNKEWKAGERVEKVTHRKDACIYCGACSAACPVGAITVRKTAILPDMKKKQIFEKKLVGQPTPRPVLTSTLITDEAACRGCGNCVIVCPVNAFSDPYLAAGHLNEIDGKPLLEVENGIVNVVNQEVCGACATCSLICPTNAIRLEKREVA